ncbi:unnamed protein product [Paramecium sonneborni]|uniref:Uncharacterized protein n=1 Tax=Paramecium sonneborni TaxID=65129 RepID=A0A8S1RTF8_9CILI|nr:unnamed protein product [Paramecium sonneborni]
MLKLFSFLKSDKYKNSFISGSGFALCYFVPYNQSQPEFWIEKFRIPWVQADFNTFEISSYENFMVTGDNENVKFWSFENFLQFLKSDKYKNSFISGSGFALCFFVPYNQSQPEFWIEKFRIPWVQADFNTFEISSYENFMVTGDNENVKFWSFENQFVCQQIIAQHESSIQALSINPDENSVISIALKDHYINVMAISDKQIWYVKQVIQSPDVLQKICFITNQIFVAQLGQGYQATKDIQLFKINTAEKFYMFNKIPIKGKGENWYFSFQTVYNPIKQILILQNGKQLNIIRFTNLNTQFKSNQGYFECNMVLKLQLFMEHQVMMESFQQLGMTNLIELKQEYIIMKMNKNNIINIENIDVQKLYFLIYFFLEFKG